ncbi:MAG: DnaD domain protein [Oscillospiraceae bacterium]|nr:DnaD domain protein [Oscillospiraceae bacterium]
MDNFLKIIEIAKTLELTPADLKRAYDFWVAAETSGNVKAGPSSEVANEQMRPTYKIDEITAAIDRDKNLNFLYKHAQVLLGKTLSATDIQILYSFYDYYEFPAEVAVMMLTYAVGREKRNMRYIEKIAIDWAEKGIMTVDDAEHHIKKLEQRAKRENKIRHALGIADRKLTQTEEQFIRSWANDMKVPLELVPVAYERMINGTGGKFSCAYMNRIFENWIKAGIKTVDQIAAHEAEYKSSRSPASGGGTVKPSKFNNFAGTSGVDYAEAAKQKMNRG